MIHARVSDPPEPLGQRDGSAGNTAQEDFLVQQQAPTSQKELSNFSFRRVSRGGSRKGWSIIICPIQEEVYHLGTDAQLTDQANTWGEGKGDHLWLKVCMF